MQHKINKPYAIAVICGSHAYPNLHGQVRFYKQQHCVLVEADIQGLPHTDAGFFDFISTREIAAQESTLPTQATITTLQ